MNLEKTKEANQIAVQIQEADIQSFILKNQKKHTTEFLRLIADQYISRQKAKAKLPTWFDNPTIVFPQPLSVEQASSEIAAEYKALFFEQHDLGIDLTGGMGIDVAAFAKHAKSVIYTEQNKDLAAISTYNFEQLGFKNIVCVDKNSIDFLQNFKEKLDWIFIDPARRDSSKNKVFLIEDCEPNVLEISDLLLKKADKILIKYSPLLDIKLAIKQLGFVSEVHIVAIENEVKELLFFYEKTNQSSAIKCINFLSDKSVQTFSFDYKTESEININYSKPKTYLYEPNASIMKAGAFKSIAKYFGLEKIAPNSHLYTSENLVENFMGRTFLCKAVCKFDKKEIMSYLPNNQANISVRNFPMKPEEIKKKLNLRDGGNMYLFATENFEKQKIVLVCEKNHR